MLLINKKYSHINIKEVRQIIYELLLKPTTMVCGLVVLGDAQDALSVWSKDRVQIWTHLGYFHQCPSRGWKAMARHRPLASQ